LGQLQCVGVAVDPEEPDPGPRVEQRLRVTARADRRVDEESSALG
jgi:hypothetical protein